MITIATIILGLSILIFIIMNITIFACILRSIVVIGIICTFVEWVIKEIKRIKKNSNKH